MKKEKRKKKKNEEKVVVSMFTSSNKWHRHHRCVLLSYYFETFNSSFKYHIKIDKFSHIAVVDIYFIFHRKNIDRFLKLPFKLIHSFFAPLAYKLSNFTPSVL